MKKLFSTALMGAFFFALFLFIFSSVTLAIEITLSDTPAQAGVNEEFNSHLVYKSTVKNTKYYLRACFYLQGTSDYFGCVKNDHDEWVCGSAGDKTTYFEMTTDNEGNWEGDLTLKADSGSGDYKTKIRRYTAAGSSEDSNEIAIKILANLTDPSPSSSSNPSPNPSTSSKATYKINEVKNADGEILASVKIYIDDNYTGHYAPETFNFCDGCSDGGFGQHTIKLEKNDYQNWSETRNFISGDNYEVNPQLNRQQSSSPSPSTSLPVSPQPSVKTASPSPKVAIKGSPSPKILLSPSPSSSVLPSSSLFPSPSPLPSSSPEILGASVDKKKYLLPAVFILGGLGLMIGAFAPVIISKLRERGILK